MQTKFKTFRIQQTPRDPKTGKPRPAEVEIEGVDAFAVLGKFLKRGVNGLGKSWTLTRQPDGWIVAVNASGRTLERAYVRLKEVDWSRNGPQGL
jgi:hypothetical protein